MPERLSLPWVWTQRTPGPVSWSPGLSEPQTSPCPLRLFFPNVLAAPGTPSQRGAAWARPPPARAFLLRMVLWPRRAPSRRPAASCEMDSWLFRVDVKAFFLGLQRLLVAGVGVQPAVVYRFGGDSIGAARPRVCFRVRRASLSVGLTGGFLHGNGLYSLHGGNQGPRVVSKPALPPVAGGAG